MLTEVTSLFDYFNKCSHNKLYRRAAIAAYRHNYKKIVTFREAKKWIDKWADETVRNAARGTGYQNTCESMTEFLNRFIARINQASEARKARRPHTVEGATPTPATEAPAR